VVDTDRMKDIVRENLPNSRPYNVPVLGQLHIL
jgi:hypothetical protein